MNTFHISFKEDVRRFKINFGEFSIKTEKEEIMPEEYSGPMEVTPMNYSQELATAEKYVTNNIHIHSVPYSVTTNIKKGITITIGV